MDRNIKTPLAFLLVSLFLLVPLLKDKDRDVVYYLPAVLLAKKKSLEVSSRPPPPEIDAHAYIVKVMGVKEPLLERRKNKPLPIASLTKLLTALLAFERIGPLRTITVSAESKGVGEKISGVPIGESVLRDEAIRFALIESDNDFAMALAEEVGYLLGGEEYIDKLRLFRDWMNQRARELGLSDSVFVNPTGLDVLSGNNNYSTAEDLSVLAEYMWYNTNTIWDHTRAIEATFTSGSAKVYKLATTNELLKEFPSILGGKTGTTDFAGESLLLIYPVGKNQKAVIVILRSNDRFEDGRKIIKWLESAF